MFAVANSHLAALLFAISDDEHIRNLLQLSFPNLEVHFLTSVIHGGADTGGIELLLNAAGVFSLAIRDGKYGRLHRREPQRESSSVVLDQDSEETFDGAVQCAMHHD